AALTSMVFVALNHGFGALFAPVGKFVALVLIALQISGAGGTYPTPTLPRFFQVVHPYLPITHAVDAFRGAVGGGWLDPPDEMTAQLVGGRVARPPASGAALRLPGADGAGRDPPPAFARAWPAGGPGCQRRSADAREAAKRGGRGCAGPERPCRGRRRARGG